MSVELTKYVRADKTGLADLKRADEISELIFKYMNTRAVQQKIREANAPGASSAEIQSIILKFASNLGFRDECEGLFESYPNRALRPDYYLPLSESGILLEVERGKTTINNMDLLDFWKCHLCEKANFLFLMVPRELRQNPQMSPRREFNTVSKRMASFFEPRNYTNVYGLWLFGY